MTWDRGAVERLVAGSEVDNEMTWDAAAADGGGDPPPADYVDGWNDCVSANAAPLVAALRSALAEVDRLTVERDHFELVGRAYLRVKELDDICEAHPGLDDAAGNDAESELMTLTNELRGLVNAYRATRRATRPAAEHDAVRAVIGAAEAFRDTPIAESRATKSVERVFDAVDAYRAARKP